MPVVSLIENHAAQYECPSSEGQPHRQTGSPDRLHSFQMLDFLLDTTQPHSVLLTHIVGRGIDLQVWHQTNESVAGQPREKTNQADESLLLPLQKYDH